MGGKMWKSSLPSVKKDDIGTANGILEGVSSLHSWIKKTNVLPTAKMSHIRSQYDEVKKNKSFLNTVLTKVIRYSFKCI